MQSNLFRIKVVFCRRKPATKFLCAKTVSGKIIRYSLALDVNSVISDRRSDATCIPFCNATIRLQ